MSRCSSAAWRKAFPPQSEKCIRGRLAFSLPVLKRAECTLCNWSIYAFLTKRTVWVEVRFSGGGGVM